MPRPSKLYWSDRDGWRTTIKGKPHYLGRDNSPAGKRQAQAAFHRLMAATLETVRTDRPQTIAGVVDAWLNANPRTAYPGWLRHFVKFAGRVHLCDIERDLLTRYHVYLTKIETPRTRRKTDDGTWQWVNPKPLCLETIRNFIGRATAVLRWAYDLGWISIQPLKPKIETPSRNDRDVDPARLAEIMDALDQPRLRRARRIIAFIATTGCRPSEACRLEWRHTHLDQGICILPPQLHKSGSKTRKPRTIYLTDEATDVLHEAWRTRAKDDGIVFRNRFGKAYTSKGLCSILRRHGGITPYQLRHTFAQNQADRGTVKEVLAKLLGHTTDRITERYFKVRDQRAIAAVKAAGAPVKLAMNQSA